MKMAKLTETNYKLTMDVLARSSRRQSEFRFLCVKVASLAEVAICSFVCYFFNIQTKQTKSNQIHTEACM